MSKIPQCWRDHLDRLDVERAFQNLIIESNHFLQNADVSYGETFWIDFGPDEDGKPCGIFAEKLQDPKRWRVIVRGCVIGKGNRDG